MNAADLLALADRVEREEPSDDLNFAIAQTLPVTPGKPRWREYVTSLDAAEALVPSGWRWELEPNGRGWCVRFDKYIVAKAKVSNRPAAALTAAALRARAQEMKDAR